jgi:hypothetical protein
MISETMFSVLPICTDHTGAPETPDGFLNEMTFQSRVEKFINTGQYISTSIKNLF